MIYIKVMMYQDKMTRYFYSLGLEI